MSATETLLRPAWRMTPSSRSDLTAANCSSRGDLRVDAVQLPEADAVDAEPAAALVGLLDEVFGPAEGDPHLRAGSRQAGLGGDEDVAVGMQRFADQLLGDIRPIGIGGVDEVHAELGQALQRADRFGPVGRLAPNSAAGDAHRAEAEAVDLDIAADPEGTGFCCIEGCHLPRLSFAIGLMQA